jgi:hypothetical protein
MSKEAWSQEEELIAKDAFDKALNRELELLLSEVKYRIENTMDPAKIWEIQSYLDFRRKEIDRKFDFRYHLLLRVFGQLLAENLLSEPELAGLSVEKLDAIKTYSGYWTDIEED